MKYPIFAIVLLLLHSRLAIAADPPKNEAAAYRIDAKVTLNGEVVSRPQILTREGVPFSVRIGRDLDPPTMHRKRKLAEGWELTGVTYLHYGQLYLDATYSISKADHQSTSKRLRIVTTTAELIEPIQLNQPIKVELDNDGSCLEFRVRQVVATSSE